jgi:hypothetical protein
MSTEDPKTFLIGRVIEGMKRKDEELVAKHEIQRDKALV